MSDSSLIPVQVRLRGDLTVTVMGEPTASPHLAITPGMSIHIDTGRVELRPHLALTHIPTGLRIGWSTEASTVWGAPIREAADLLAGMADWSTKPSPEEARAMLEACRSFAKNGATIHV